MFKSIEEWNAATPAERDAERRAFEADWNARKVGWEGQRVTYTGATKMDDGEPADGYSGCGVVTDEIPCHGSHPILNVRCDTHGPVTVQAEHCEAVAEGERGQ